MGFTNDTVLRTVRHDAAKYEKKADDVDGQVFNHIDFDWPFASCASISGNADIRDDSGTRSRVYQDPCFFGR